MVSGNEAFSVESYRKGFGRVGVDHVTDLFQCMQICRSSGMLLIGRVSKKCMDWWNLISTNLGVDYRCCRLSLTKVLLRSKIEFYRAFLTSVCMLCCDRCWSFISILCIVKVEGKTVRKSTSYTIIWKINEGNSTKAITIVTSATYWRIFV